MTFFEGYLFKNGRTFIVTDDDEEVDFCPEIKVIETITAIEDGSQTVVVSIKGYEPFEIPRETLVGDLLAQLVRHGLSVPDVKEYRITIAEILFDTEKAAIKTYAHKKVGFHKFKGKLYYWGHDVCSSKFQSRYVGNLNLDHRGTFESWHEGVFSLVKAFPATAVALAMGASAPVVYLLQRVSVVDESIITSIIGRSSVGKTTMLKLAASVWGKPTLDGVITPFTGSEAGFYTSLSDKLGFTHFVDETSTGTKIDPTSLIYEITMNREGNKCLGDGTLRQPKKWMGTVMFTGEKSLLSHTNQNSGLYARVAEFDIPWFEGEGVAEAIKAHVAKNYGTAYPLLIDKLKQYKSQTLADMYKKCCDELGEKAPDCSNIGKRLLKKYAILLLTVDITARAWSLEVEREKVVELLLTAFKQCLPDTDVIQKFYEDFLTYISSHANMYPTSSKKEMFSTPKLGVQETYKYRRCVWITVSTFEELLNKSGLGCSDGILHEMKDKGMLEYFSDRFRRSHTIGEIKLPCFCVYLDGDDHKKILQKNADKKSKNKLQKKKINDKSPQLKNLLA